MKKSLLLPLLLATGSTAFGQIYFGAGVGYFFPESDSSITSIISGGESNPEDGIGAIANIGYKVPTNGWHFEFEFQYFEPDSSVTSQATGAQSAAATGSNLGTGTYYTKNNAENYTYALNVYYDVLDSLETNWGLYAGGGIGATNLHQKVRVSGPGGTVSDSNDKWLFTYQFLAGISYEPIEHLRFDFAYRYTLPENSNFTLFNQNVPVDSYDYQSLELSASYMF